MKYKGFSLKCTSLIVYFEFPCLLFRLKVVIQLLVLFMLQIVIFLFRIYIFYVLGVLMFCCFVIELLCLNFFKFCFPLSFFILRGLYLH